MTRDEAMIEMLAGRKVRHRYFDPYEWITAQDNMVLTGKYKANTMELLLLFLVHPIGLPQQYSN